MTWFWKFFVSFFRVKVNINWALKSDTFGVWLGHLLVKYCGACIPWNGARELVICYSNTILVVDLLLSFSLYMPVVFAVLAIMIFLGGRSCVGGKMGRCGGLDYGSEQFQISSKPPILLYKKSVQFWFPVSVIL